MGCNPPGREIPASEEAEQHVLACCLLDSQQVTRAVCAGVRDECFYQPQNAILWNTILELYTTSRPVTLEVLAEELTTKKLFEQVGGFPYLMQVTGKIPTTAHAGYMIEKLIEKKALRDTIRIGTTLIEKSYTYSGGGIASHISPVLEDLTKIQSGTTARDERTIQQAAEDTIKQVEAMIRGEKTTENLVSWGFADFDRLFYPMMGGELIIIAARPSVGKTTLADQIALANAFAKEPNDVAIFSLEVTVDQKPKKFAQIMSGHSWRKLPKAHEKDRVEFLQALLEIKENKRIHCFYKEQTIDGICARIKVLRQQKGIKVAIVDYLQLLELGQKDSNRNDAIGYATRKLKLLALELDMPIILLSQLNRANERDNREPRLSDLRDSGNIEQDADRVVFIHRPASDPITGAVQELTDESKSTYYQDVIQAKGRDVGTYRIGLYFHRERTTFMQIQQPNR